MHTTVVYEYVPGSEQLRAEHADAHVAFLQQLLDSGILRLSGRLDRGDGPGALLVLAADPEQAVRVLAEDPFWTAGVVGERQVWPWSVVFGAERI